MSITKSSNIITETPVADMDQFNRSGVIRKDSFAVCDNVDKLKQMKLDPSAQATNTSVTITSDAANTGAFTLPAVTSGVLAQRGVPGLLQYAAPLTGATVTITDGVASLALEPAGTIAELTVVLPTTPPNGSVVNISSSAEVTALTLNGGGSDTIKNAISALAANAFAAYVYRAANTKWYRIG